VKGPADLRRDVWRIHLCGEILSVSISMYLDTYGASVYVYIYIYIYICIYIFIFFVETVYPVSKKFGGCCAAC